jgi:HSP20 family protein
MLETGQSIPVRVHETAERITIDTPMPGLAPEDITVTVTGDGVILRGQERGPRERPQDLFLLEWTVGPYYREVALPHLVNGRLASATYEAGVLVVSLPKAGDAARATRADFQLHPIRDTRGDRVGHAGQGSGLWSRKHREPLS